MFIDPTPMKHSGTTCRYCSSTVRKIPVPKEAPHPTQPLILCVRCDRAELWPGVG